MINDQAIKTSDNQKYLTKRYQELFRFVEKTGEEIFVFPKKYKVGISLKPADVLREDLEYSSPEFWEEIEKSKKSGEVSSKQIKRRLKI